MNTLQDLGNWGSSLIGQAQVQLAPAAAAAAVLASKGLQQGSDLVKQGAKAVKSSLKENLGGLASASHTFEDPQGGGVRTVNEVAHIAEGAFGEVSRVADARSGKEYALKKIRCAEGVQVASSLEAAQLEAKILSSLPPHPNIIRCFGYSIDAHPGGGSTVKLLLELCGGGHLLDFMDSRQGKLSARDVIDPFLQITDAVRHLHAQRPPIQHRDLKVENVLLGADGSWKLCDFGSCSTERVPAEELSRTRLYKLQEEIDKTVTMLYRPPEMADIELNFRKGYTISEQVDIWMLGCILYTLAFYRHPFQDNATAMAITNAKYFIPKEHNLARSSKLVGLIHWLLAADPKDRPTSSKLYEVLTNIGKVQYPALLESMPRSVQEKIQKLQDLFRVRRDVEPPSLDSNGKLVVPPPSAASASASSAAASRAPRAEVGRGAREGNDRYNSPADDSGFDLRFCLASDEAPPAPASSSSPPSASAPSSVARSGGAGARPAAGAREPEDLLSLGSPHRGPSAAPSAPAPADGGFDLLSFTDPFQPAAPSLPAALPTVAAPAPSPSPGGAIWDGFADFTAAPAPPAPVAAPWPAAATPQQGGSAAGFNFCATGFDDFADFTAAPAPFAAAPARPAPSGQANLLDLDM